MKGNNKMKFYKFTKAEKQEYLLGCEAFRKEMHNFDTVLDACEQVMSSFESDPPDTPFQLGFMEEAHDVGCNEVDPQDH